MMKSGVERKKLQNEGIHSDSLLLEGMGLLRFELKSITPEATRIPSYPTGPRIKTAIG